MTVDRITRRSISVSLAVHLVLVLIALVRMPWWSSPPPPPTPSVTAVPPSSRGGELVLAPEAQRAPVPALPALTAAQQPQPALPALPVVMPAPMRRHELGNPSEGADDHGRRDAALPKAAASNAGVAAELRGRASAPELSHDDDMRRTAANLLQGLIEAQWIRSWSHHRPAVTNRAVFLEIRHDGRGRILAGRVAPGTTGVEELDRAIGRWLTDGGLVLPPFAAGTCLFKVTLW